MEFLFKGFVIGAGATLIFDLWVRFVIVGLGLPGANWTLGGRWFAHMPRGRFRHESIAAAPSLPGETAVGWTMHYLIGIAYGLILLALCGPDWGRAPTLWPALAFGLVTVLAGWLIMAPCMGAGIAASKAPRPMQVRAVQLSNHAVFGVAMWLWALLAAAAWG
ncbi:DUF2938 family protein [Oceanicella sp. SM1341]|uniref:DUF2938 family protein n=1 Tax=Oceanicella sp. SM1341 TaxID=1548889 RepID=UPI000E4BCFA7|nr:DUF2938 family protein [Oceanicella sp. SM1341]